MKPDLLLHTLMFFSAFLAAKWMFPFFFELLHAAGALKNNWQGKAIPTTAGLVFPLVISVAWLPFGLAAGARDMMVYLFALFAITFLGLMDDLLGNTAQKGLRGHFLLLFREKRLSTGVVKALGTGIVALWVVLYFQRATPFLDWLILVLAVNFINLLDLRPGRALKGTILLFFPALLLPIDDYRLLAATAGLICAYARYDMHGLVMLGDSGANTLGMIGGLVLLQAPFFIKGFCLMFLVILHLIAESYSFSKIIERYAWLNMIDRWGRN